jgi:hypothetical protein
MDPRVALGALLLGGGIVFSAISQGVRQELEAPLRRGSVRILDPARLARRAGGWRIDRIALLERRLERDISTMTAAALALGERATAHHALLVRFVAPAAPRGGGGAAAGGAVAAARAPAPPRAVFLLAELVNSGDVYLSLASSPDDALAASTFESLLRARRREVRRPAPAAAPAAVADGPAPPCAGDAQLSSPTARLAEIFAPPKGWFARASPHLSPESLAAILEPPPPLIDDALRVHPAMAARLRSTRWSIAEPLSPLDVLPPAPPSFASLSAAPSSLPAPAPAPPSPAPSPPSPNGASLTSPPSSAGAAPLGHNTAAADGAPSDPGSASGSSSGSWAAVDRDAASLPLPPSPRRERTAPRDIGSPRPTPLPRVLHTARTLSAVLARLEGARESLAA